MGEFDWHRLRRDVEKQLEIIIDSKVGDVRDCKHALGSIRQQV